MASIYYSLSTKKSTDNKSEILIRFSHGRINQRSRSNIFIEEEYWDEKNQQIIIPKFRILSPDKKIKDYLANLGEKLIGLSNLIQKSFNEVDKEHLSKDWLKLLIARYNFPDPNQNRGYEIVPALRLKIIRLSYFIMQLKDKTKSTILVIYIKIEPSSFTKKEREKIVIQTINSTQLKVDRLSTIFSSSTDCMAAFFILG